MKKKTIAFVILLTFFTAAISACKPSGMSDTVYNLGCNAYEIMSDYLDGTLISSDDCEEQLQPIYNRLDEYEKSIADDTSKTHDRSYCGTIKNIVKCFELALGISGITSNYTELKDYHDNLGDILGV